MSQDTEKYERLVTLAGWLWLRIRDGRPYFRRSELAQVEGLDHFGAHGAAGRKAFDRAKEELESFGIAIKWNDHIVRDNDPNLAGAYRVSGLKLTPEQQQALIGLAFTIAYRDLSTDVAMRIPGSYLEGAGDTLLLEANRFVAPVAEAIDERRCVRIVYQDDPEPRDAQPLHLGYQRGNWYLAANEVGANEMKTFRLDRISSFETTDMPWSDDYDIDEARSKVARVENRFFWGDGEVKHVTLAIDEDAVMSAGRLLPELAEIGEDPWGRPVMTHEYSNEENMLDAVLTLGRRAEILKPPDLRQAMIDRLSAMIGASE